MLNKKTFDKLYRRFLGSRAARVQELVASMRHQSQSGNLRRARKIQKRLELKYGVLIPSTAQIGERLRMPHPVGIIIGKNVRIGNDVKIYQNVTIGGMDGNYPSIGNGVTIYAGSNIIGNVTIGDNAVIGAGSVVVKDIPSQAVAVGNPARPLTR